VAAWSHEEALNLVGDVPSGTSLTIEECRCLTRKGEDVYRVARPLDNPETLQPGAHPPARRLSEPAVSRRGLRVDLWDRRKPGGRARCAIVHPCV
jgi:hypothetical protein